MKLNELRTFVTVAEAQSVQEAAARLHLTQSAVSRLIQRLEGELGVALFDRNTKPLTLTVDGQVALPHARRVLKASDAMTEVFADDAEPRGPLRLGSSHVLAGLAAGVPLDALRTSFPGLTARLVTGWSDALLAKLASGAIDAAVILQAAGADPPPGLDGRRIALEEVKVVARPDLLARTGRTLAAMNEVGWVLQPPRCSYRAALEAALERHGAAANVTVEAFDQELLLSLAARGVGFGMAPLRILASSGYGGRLVPVDVEGLQVTVALWLLRTKPAGRLAGVLDAFESLLRDALAPHHSVSE